VALTLNKGSRNQNVVTGLDFYDGNKWIRYLRLDRPAERQTAITFK